MWCDLRVRRPLQLLNVTGRLCCPRWMVHPHVRGDVVLGPKGVDADLRRRIETAVEADAIAAYRVGHTDGYEAAAVLYNSGNS